MSGFQTQVPMELPNTTADVPVVQVLRARDFQVTCPHCGHVTEGWAKDPRGKTDKCDECGSEYRIPRDVPIVFD